MYRPCDFCHSIEKEVTWYYYKSEVIKRVMKVCLCDECATRETEQLRGKIQEGDIRWKPDNT